MTGPDRARATLQAAFVLARAGHLRDAVSRAYYAGFYAARAALQARGSHAGTHRGVASEFSRLLVQGGHVPPEASVWLRRLATARAEADYDDGDALDLPAVQALLDASARLVAAAESAMPPGTGASPPAEPLTDDQKRDLVAQLTREMDAAAENLEFEKAAEPRDAVAQIEAQLAA